MRWASWLVAVMTFSSLGRDIVCRSEGVETIRRVPFTSYGCWVWIGVESFTCRSSAIGGESEPHVETPWRVWIPFYCMVRSPIHCPAIPNLSPASSDRPFPGLRSPGQPYGTDIVVPLGMVDIYR